MLPPPAFHSATLKLHRLAPGARFCRIFPTKHANPFGYGKTPSRFSDPRTDLPLAERFGVLYLGESLEVCFLEAVLRDKRNGRVGEYPLPEQELKSRAFARMEVTRPLKIVDLRHNGLVTLGMPTDAVKASDQGLGRAWSLALYTHLGAPDGIIYPSRLNGSTNFAVYDRALESHFKLIEAGPLFPPDPALSPGLEEELAMVLDEFEVALTP